MTLTVKQKGVLRGIATGGALTLAAVLGTGFWQPEFLVPADTFKSRVSFALYWSILPMLCLVFSIGRLARHRFFTSEDIDGGGMTSGTETAHIMQAALQNTLEQTALALPVYLIWSVTMSIGFVPAVAGAACCFFVGRILFQLGYARGAPSRALGFALTFYPSALMTVTVAGVLAARVVESVFG